MHYDRIAQVGLVGAVFRQRVSVRNERKLRRHFLSLGEFLKHATDYRLDRVKLAIQDLIDGGFVDDPSDIFTLTAEDLMQLPLFLWKRARRSATETSTVIYVATIGVSNSVRIVFEDLVR